MSQFSSHAELLFELPRRGPLLFEPSRSFDRTTGSYDNVVKFELPLEALGQIVETFVTLGFPGMGLAASFWLQGPTMSRQIIGSEFWLSEFWLSEFWLSELWFSEFWLSEFWLNSRS